jgi:hypothetical protein
MSEVQIRGTDLARLARQLREAGEKGLQRELGQGINRAMKPLKAELKQSALNTLPSAGGLAAKVAASRFRTRRRSSMRVSGIRLEVVNDYALGLLDKGIVKHPVFGRGKKVTQRIEPGWFTRPTMAAAPRVRFEIQQAMQRVANQIQRGV